MNTNMNNMNIDMNKSKKKIVFSIVFILMFRVK